MTEAEYQYECSRAELLGIPKPTWEEFLNTKQQKSVDVTEKEDEITFEESEFQEIESKREGFQRIGGGLDELNSILSSTQKKLNRFKTVCGSFGNLLKLHVGSKKEEEKPNNANLVEEMKISEASVTNRDKVSDKTTIDSQCLDKKGDTHSELDKLDSLISKAERAELSLSSQNKQMKKFINQ